MKTIQLSNPVAKEVIKDLIQGDADSKELQAMIKLVTVTNEKLITQSDLVSNLKLQTNTLNNIILQKDSQLQTSAEMSKDLQSQIYSTAISRSSSHIFMTLYPIQYSRR